MYVVDIQELRRTAMLGMSVPRLKHGVAQLCQVTQWGHSLRKSLAFVQFHSWSDTEPRAFIMGRIAIMDTCDTYPAPQVENASLAHQLYMATLAGDPVAPMALTDMGEESLC